MPEKDKPKPRLLFVEADEYIRSSVSSRFIELLDDYVIETAGNAAEAVNKIEDYRPEVVVVNQQLPDINGETLIGQIKASNPDTIRILLTDRADRYSSGKSKCSAHHYLPVSCNSHALAQSIARAKLLSMDVLTSSLKKSLSKMESLPSLPTVYFELVDRLNDPETSIREIAQIVTKDIGMSANVLQLVNSAFFGLPKKVDDINLAVSLLGVDTFSDLVLMMSVFSQFSEKQMHDFSLDYLSEHSVNTAKAAKAISKTEGLGEPEQKIAYSAGLLHDIGKLVFVVNKPDLYAKAIELSNREKISLHLAEEKVIGNNHQQVGAYLLDQWGFPGTIIEAVAYHHSPEKIPLEGMTPAIAVHISNYFEHMLNPNREKIQINEMESYFLSIEYLKNAGLGKKVRNWLEIYQGIIRYSV